MFLASISYSLFNGWTGRSLKRGDGIESKNGRGPVNRERGNEHGRERERECGRDWGHGRERERECGRDRGHGRDKERERGCDNDRERDSRRERDQERERGYDQAGSEMDHGYSHGKEAGYGSESKHGRKGRAQGEEILSMICNGVCSSFKGEFCGGHIHLVKHVVWKKLLQVKRKVESGVGGAASRLVRPAGRSCVCEIKEIGERLGGDVAPLLAAELPLLEEGVIDRERADPSVAVDGP
ncbi:hypothetical protein BHM03_00035776 [Ensete ventricosum]|nr:hypothetical protein BHM03_00035776 [Ensete ventricosum]